MSRYLLINILTVLFPLILTFENKIKFYKKLPALLLSILIVSSAYIIWDVIATMRGDWGFNPEFLTGIYFFNLPLEEILFFITVPYSCVFILETVNLYIKEQELKFNRFLFTGLGVMLAIAAVPFYSQYYTFTVMLFSAAFLIYTSLFSPEILRSSNYFISIGITYIPFLVVNYFLTAPPIVWYSDEAIWGGRFITIPYEDFFYSFSMISWWYYFYLLFKKKFAKVDSH